MSIFFKSKYTILDKLPLYLLYQSKLLKFVCCADTKNALAMKANALDSLKCTSTFVKDRYMPAIMKHLTTKYWNRRKMFLGLFPCCLKTL